MVRWAGHHEVEPPQADRVGDPVEGRVIWDRTQILWNGGMIATALLAGPATMAAAGVVTAVGLAALTMLGFSVGMHRHLAHRAFDCGPTVRRVLAWLGVLSG